MVAMFMGQEHGVNVAQLQTCCDQPGLKLLDPKTAIYQKSQLAASNTSDFNNSGIARTAAAKTLKPQGLDSPLAAFLLAK